MGTLGRVDCRQNHGREKKITIPNKKERYVVCHVFVDLRNILYNYHLGKGSKKEVWNFPYFSGVGGFEKVIFHKK